MGALSIAFDITIVGALALPWVLLVVHLFFLGGEGRLGEILQWVKNQDQAAAVGVVLFAVTYTLGSAVSRIAQDFSNDDDLHFRIGDSIWRVGATENRILTTVYCNRDYSGLLRAGADNPALQEKIYTFGSQKTEWLCRQSSRWIANRKHDFEDEDLNGTAADIFGLQESALTLKGEDPTFRLRQMHDQIMVLRGAAFNGMLAFALCLYGCGQKIRREKPGSFWRWPLRMVPIFFAVVGGIALGNHISDGTGSDPPYMEFCLLLLGVSGALLLWWPRGESKEEVPKRQNAPCRGWLAFTVLSAILAVIAFFGWWSTEVTYAQHVIYAYDSKDATYPQK